MIGRWNYSIGCVLRSPRSWTLSLRHHPQITRWCARLPRRVHSQPSGHQRKIWFPHAGAPEHHAEYSNCKYKWPVAWM